MLKKFSPLLALALAGFISTGVHAETLSIAATPVPHEEILQLVKPDLEAEGIELDIKVFTDYILPDQEVVDGNIDANFFQHVPYMNEFNKQHKSNLVSLGTVHVEPFGAYSNKIDSIDELKDGALIALPNDPSNGGRALLLLEQNGLIKLKDPDNVLATANDVVENPKKLKFKELEAATLPRVLADVDVALINTNYALEAGLDPTKDALFIEDKESPYANVIATLEENKDDPRIQKLLSALQTDKVKDFINDKYKGAIVPAF